MDKVIFWDFHGTLANNDWMFSKALYKVLYKYEPNCGFNIDNIKKQLITGFPWQEPEKEYIHLTHPDVWWEHIYKIFVKVYTCMDITEEKAGMYAKEVRYELIQPDEYILYEDTIETLNFFKNKGFSNIILSNHIPELPEIAKQIGLAECIDGCISSANVGFEKPNSRIYEYALKISNYPSETWMVGDSIIADVKGAEGAGIKGVLVRSPKEGDVKCYSKDLRGLKDIIR